MQFVIKNIHNNIRNESPTKTLACVICACCGALTKGIHIKQTVIHMKYWCNPGVHAGEK